MPTYIKDKNERAKRRKRARTLLKYKHRMRRSQIIRGYSGRPNILISTGKSKKRKGGCPFCA